MLTQGISMWLTARAGRGGGAGWERRRERGECSPAAKWREIVGRNGSGRRFEPFANQIAIIDGNNHTVETSLSPGLVFFPWRSPFALFRSIAGSNVNNILFCQYYLPYTSLPSPSLLPPPSSLSSTIVNSFVHLRPLPQSRAIFQSPPGSQPVVSVATTNLVSILQ